MNHPAFVPTLYKVTIGLLILLVANAFAADSASLISGEFNAKQKIERTEIAKDIKSQIDLLDSYLPNLKPSEIEWIDQERIAIKKLEGTDAWSARLTQFYESPEFQQQKLKNLLGSIKSNIDCIMNEKVNLNTEMLCWTVTSYNLSDRSTFDDSIMTLKKHTKLPNDIVKKAGLWEASGYGAKFETYARGIIEYIVIPYLAGKIK